MSVISVVPDTVDLELYGGDSFSLKLFRQNSDQTPLDLTGTYLAQIKSTSGATVTSFACDGSQAASGVLFITLTKAQTASLVASVMFFRGTYDVQWTDPLTNTLTLIRGSLTCTKDISV